MDLKQIISSKTGLTYKYNTSDKLRGASILEPQGDVFKDVVSLDFRSFYPSIIVSYDIFGPEMSKWLIEMFYKKQQGNKDAKLAMNSIYGMMKHFDINKAQKVTQIGREWIRELRDYLKSIGFNVIYSHTDSVMVCDVNGDFLNKAVEKYNEIRLRMMKSDNIIIGVEIENKFKYIYFKKTLDNTFAKNTYIGVNHDDSWVMKGNWKPTLEEIKHIDFVKYMLSRGKYIVTSKDLQEYICTYTNSTDKIESFINLEDMNILSVERNTIHLD